MIILASTSPRRKALLEEYGYTFKVVAPLVNEADFNYVNASDYALNLSKLKAYSLYKDYKNDLIIACDTIVIFNNKIYEKPKSYDEAFRMIKSLSGNTHFVLSAYTILHKEIEINKTVKTYVTFKDLSDDEIKKYLGFATFLDKAGAYAIQDKNCNFVKNINGLYSNVVGFPIEEIAKNLAKLNYFPNKEL